MASAALLASCPKVPFVSLDASFTISDVSWFEDEQTMFVFYTVTAEAGLGESSTVELTYRTDDVTVPWTPLDQFVPVHTHLPIDCGPNQRCGSLSLHVPKPPRGVGLRFRYHRSGPLALDAPTVFNVVATGEPHLSRSLVVYGVFDELNSHVQWRARHQFPTVRNEDATRLGLRRAFRIEQQTHGDVTLPFGNPYGYGSSPICPVSFVDLPFAPLATSNRAVREPTELPLSTSASAAMCAQSTVTDALGEFTTSAFARKNPVVRPAFPALRTPVREATRLGFVLRPCNRVISEEHLTMQIQRLLIEGEPTICLDDPGDLAMRITDVARRRIDAQRVIGKDMVLLFALHHDDTTGQVGRALETALTTVLTPERDKPSPRVSGAFVFDSTEHRLTDSLRSLVLWCRGPKPRPPLPADTRDCPIVTEIPSITLGPFTLNQLPILASRVDYLDFVSKYSDAQAGRMRTLRALTPERSAITETVRVGDFGLVTIFNSELITAAPADAFSYCEVENGPANFTVARPTGTPEALPFPIQALPQVHAAMPSASYSLGLTWESPFLIRGEYEKQLAVLASVASFSVPFGIASEDEAYFGSRRWENEVFPLADALAQCTRWCEHPTFDSSGQYQPLVNFRDGYAANCYRPRQPREDDSQALKEFPGDL